MRDRAQRWVFNVVHGLTLLVKLALVRFSRDVVELLSPPPMMSNKSVLVLNVVTDS
jgi:hypothetical protein